MMATPSSIEPMPNCPSLQKVDGDLRAPSKNVQKQSGRSLVHLCFRLPFLLSLGLAAFVFGIVASPTPLGAQVPAAPNAVAAISEAEALQPPTPSRLTAIHAAAQRDGWRTQVESLRAAALLAYKNDKLVAAEAWFHAYRWAALWSEPESSFVPRWIQAINDAKAGHAGLNSLTVARAQPLGASLSPELQLWLLSNASFSGEFFRLITPVDFLPKVFQALNDIYRADAVHFKTHSRLALAIAVVFDVPPPPIWPHGQVTEAALPRKFPPATEAFAWWVKQDQLGQGFHRLTRLGADELKFVVDTAAPFAELEWASKMTDYPLNQLARAYTMVRYRNDRVANNNPIWPGRTYKLVDILRDGGICCDQAYFATQVGKSRCVPTLLFAGAGNDGRHAWFGFLDAGQKWQMDAGRYAEQRYVTGYARDPQTWKEISDHELQFLTERFRELPSYRQSLIHAYFAADYLAAGEATAAAAAARKAVGYERRNQAAWETLIAAGQKLGRDAKTIETVMREAALAFRTYPDLEALYVARTADSLRKRGETSLADAEVAGIARKNQSGRSDLSAQQAHESLVRAFSTQPLPQQITAYNSLIDTAGRGAGIGFFDQVVVFYAEHMMQLQQPAEAIRGVERARRTLKVEPNSQLDQEFGKLLSGLKSVR